MANTYIKSEFASESIQNYLKTIYQLGYRGNGAAGWEIAGAMKVSAPGVTKMLHHLSSHKLIAYTPYHPVFLTELGEKVALEVIRHHRLLELYLMESLGYGWEKVHAEAERLEHHISEEFESTIERLLGFPEYDPHGDPIPTRDGRMPPVATEKLADQTVGTKLLIRRVVDEDPELLIYLAERSLKPGTIAVVEEREPFNGSLRLLVSGRLERVSPDAAKCVFIEVCTPDDLVSECVSSCKKIVS